jgi:hypothetical protein
MTPKHHPFRSLEETQGSRQKLGRACPMIIMRSADKEDNIAA